MSSIIEYAIFIGGACALAYIWEELKPRLFKDRVLMEYDEMKRQLVRLLNKDGYQNEMNEGRIVLTYRQERFVVHFDASQLGEQYARVTIADYYVIDGMNEVHPFVMDAVMGGQHTTAHVHPISPMTKAVCAIMPQMSEISSISTVGCAQSSIC